MRSIALADLLETGEGEKIGKQRGFVQLPAILLCIFCAGFAFGSLTNRSEKGRAGLDLVEMRAR